MATAHAFAEHLVHASSDVCQLLQKYESHATATRELEWTMNLLTDLPRLAHYHSAHVDTVASFLPLNLPLYSLALYALAPSFQARQVTVKVPGLLQPLWRELAALLKIHVFFPGIVVHTGDRTSFLGVCRNADVVIFTGKYENFTKLRKMCRDSSLVIYNGVGHNPCVVADTAVVPLAVRKVLDARLFNSGQDCAAPDAILVSHAVADEFISEMVRALEKISVGTDYSDRDTVVGPLLEPSIIERFSEALSSATGAGADVIFGGRVDLRHGIVEPCVCVSPVASFVNFDELYSPLFMVATYGSEDELSLYFEDEHGKYKEKEMYVSTFGSSTYIEHGGATKSIILRE